MTRKEQEIQINNVNRYNENIERCKEAIMGGHGFAKAEGDISAGKNMWASSSIGRVRTNQEDAVLLIEHPQNSEYKMMVVADGMGGAQDGEKASADVVNGMKKWFNEVDLQGYDNPNRLEYQIAEALITLNRKMASEYGKRGAGSTVVVSIIGKNSATIANVGDSRAYLAKNGELTQVSQDHSLAENKYSTGEIEERDDMRFHKDSNKISQAMGMPEDVSPSVISLNKEFFDSIILCSDGLSDCLSDAQIMAITRNTDRRILSKKLVEAALNTDTRKREGLRRQI